MQIEKNKKDSTKKRSIFQGKEAKESFIFLMLYF